MDCCRCPEILQLLLLILFWWVNLTEIIGLLIVLLMIPIVNQLYVVVPPLIISFGQLVVRRGVVPISAGHSFLMSSTKPVHYTFLMLRGNIRSRGGGGPTEENFLI